MQQIIPNLWEIDEIGSMVHAYLWEWQGRATLIDCGLPSDGPKILDALVRHGYPVHSLPRIIITHVDLDHTGGLPHVKEKSRATVLCHVDEKEYMEHPGRRRLSSPLVALATRLSSILPAFRQHSVAPDELVVHGQTLPEGFTVIHTPGHTPGHISLLHKQARLLIAGDALANRNGKLSGPPAMFTPDMDSARASILTLAKNYGDEYETVVFGHGEPILVNGGKRVRSFATRLFAEKV